MASVLTHLESVSKLIIYLDNDTKARQTCYYKNMRRYSWIYLATSELKVQNEVSVPEPAKILANK